MFFFFICVCNLIVIILFQKEHFCTLFILKACILVLEWFILVPYLKRLLPQWQSLSCQNICIMLQLINQNQYLKIQICIWLIFSLWLQQTSQMTSGTCYMWRSLEPKEHFTSLRPSATSSRSLGWVIAFQLRSDLYNPKNIHKSWIWSIVIIPASSSSTGVLPKVRADQLSAE